VSNESRSKFRIGLAGASGALGRELVEVLEERRFPIGELVPFATEQSLGGEVELQGEAYPLGAETPPLRGLDLLLLCTPPGVALDLLREALHAQVAVIDCTGALAASEDVPLQVADLCAPDAVRSAPVIASPANAALAWSHVLAALKAEVGLQRVIATVMHSASRAGKRGIEILSNETLSLLSQNPVDPAEVFPAQVAFDCVPVPGEGESGSAAGESEIVRDLQRLIGSEVAVAVTAVQVPTFAGEGASLAIETERPISPEQAHQLFEKVPGLEVWEAGEVGPTTRDTTGREVALVGRLRRDPTVENGLLLWVAADTLRLAAFNAVKLAETRLGIA